jgi:hypothetical protein
MPIESHGHEHELEPQYGLPERLPSGETILWQGSPEFRTVALSIFHVRKVAVYFAVLLAIRAGLAANESGLWLDGLVSLAWPLPLALTALGLLTALAWMTAKTAVYTLTNKRVVMRIGIVLTLTFNVPLRTVRSAGLRQRTDRAGDIVLQLRGPDHIAYLHLWPHALPWHLARPEPMLRAVSQAPEVAALLTRAWREVNGVTESAGVAPTPVRPTRLAPGVSPLAAPAAPVNTEPQRTTAGWQPSPT